MNRLQLVPNLRDNHSFDVEALLRSGNSNWNEKYYKIILRAREQLINSNYTVKLTAASIIKECDSARPTWYSYFRGVEDYYKDILQVLGKVMVENAYRYLRANADYKDWIPVIHSLKVIVFLSNTKNLTSFYPDLRDDWYIMYNKLIDGYADILSPILKLSPNRAKLLIRNIVNEMILHPVKYTDLKLYTQFVEREYILFLAEQNS
jgi:hypothetical protein